MNEIIRDKRIIEVNNLHKSYKDVHAVKGISFYVNYGDLFAFLGPNGAGKSTTIDMLTTILEKDQGEVVIDDLTLGKDDFKIKKTIGVVFQDKVLDDNLTVIQNLTHRAKLYNFSKEEVEKRVNNAMEMTNVTSFSHRRYKLLSGGQKRKVDIARALLNTPKLLFLDEPTTGLDPKSRKDIWKTIENLREQYGMTIFLTTHYMEEADNADYVVVIVEGKIAAKGTPIELKLQYSQDYLIVKPKKDVDFKEQLDGELVHYQQIADFFKISLESSFDAIPLINKFKDLIHSFEVVSGSLDDAFVNITGKGIDEYA